MNDTLRLSGRMVTINTAVNRNKNLIGIGNLLDEIDRLEEEEHDKLKEHLQDFLDLHPDREEFGWYVQRDCFEEDIQYWEKENLAELAALRKVARHLRIICADNIDKQLIRDSYLKEWAREQASLWLELDSWPTNRIDWELAVEDLKIGLFDPIRKMEPVHYGDVVYWVELPG